MKDRYRLTIDYGQIVPVPLFSHPKDRIFAFKLPFGDFLCRISTWKISLEGANAISCICVSNTCSSHANGEFDMKQEVCSMRNNEFHKPQAD